MWLPNEMNPKGTKTDQYLEGKRNIYKRLHDISKEIFQSINFMFVSIPQYLFDIWKSSVYNKYKRENLKKSINFSCLTGGGGV